MMPDTLLAADLAETAGDLRARDEPFAFATIVRTAGPTAAKPGARALLDGDGNILRGWLGGGCTTGAVRRAAQKALADGEPRLVSVAPEDLLAEQGVTAGEAIDGKHFDRNGCPSRGVIEIFIEPYRPSPELVLIGASPVAQALADLAPRFHWDLTALEPGVPPSPLAVGRRRVVVVATQGQGDLDALQVALTASAEQVAFVGSQKKSSALAKRLVAAGHQQADVDAIKAPAGLDIGAVTPEEIALSILADLTRLRRKALVKAGS